MTKIIGLIGLDTAIGFIAYIIREPLTGHMSKDWRDICDFVLGGCYILVPILRMVHLLSEEESDTESPWIPNIILRVLVASVFSGIGFVAGAIFGFRFFPISKSKSGL